jgi:hypothetical protein
MNLTQLQIEELQQAWEEVMTEIVTFGFMRFSIGVHDIMKEVALCIEADDLKPIYRVLRHSTEADVGALQAFIEAGGCSDDRMLLVTGADLKDGTIAVKELLDRNRRRWMKH